MSERGAIGRRMREARLRIPGLKPRDVARAIGVPNTRVHLWEAGRSNPPLELLIPIARVLQVSLEWLVTGEEPSSGDSRVSSSS